MKWLLAWLGADAFPSLRTQEKNNATSSTANAADPSPLRLIDSMSDRLIEWSTPNDTQIPKDLHLFHCIEHRLRLLLLRSIHSADSVFIPTAGCFRLVATMRLIGNRNASLSLLLLLMLSLDRSHAFCSFSLFGLSKAATTTTTTARTPTFRFVLQDKLSGEEIQTRLQTRLAKLREKDLASRALTVEVRIP